MSSAMDRRESLDRNGLRARAVVRGLRDDEIRRQGDRLARLLAVVEDLARERHLVLLEQRIADRKPDRAHEVVRHAAADEEHVGAPRRATRSVSILPEIFAPPRIAAKGRSGSSRRDSSRDLLLHQEARALLGDERAARRRPTRAPGAPRRRRRRRRRRRAPRARRRTAGSFFSSPAWKRRFSSSRTSPGCERFGGLRGLGADAVVDEADGLAPGAPRSAPRPGASESFASACPSACRGAMRSTTCAPLLEREANRRQRLDDPRVVRDAPVLQRHVEVDAKEDPPAREVQVADGFHRAGRIAQ